MPSAPVAEFPVLNPSLCEWFVQAGAPALPEFDPENDGIESFLSRIAQTIGGLDRWQVERNLTLGHFNFGRLAIYVDLAPENWPDGPAAHPLVEALLRGSALRGAARSLSLPTTTSTTTRSRTRPRSSSTMPTRRSTVPSST